MSTEPAPKAVGRAEEVESEAAPRLLAELRALLAEDGPMTVTLDSDLAGLGLDSLARGELLHRLEQTFQVSLPEQAMAAATARELLGAVLAAGPRVTPKPAAAGTVLQPEEVAAAGVPDQAATLNEMLHWHARRHPERVAIRLYQDQDDREPLPISYAELLAGARRIAAGLLAHGLQPGQTVAIMLATELGYFNSFFGTLLAGGTPVPIYPPARPDQLEDHLRRHARILTNARCRLLITLPQAKTVAGLLRAQVDTLDAVVTVADLGRDGGVIPHLKVAADDLAFIQYTSGSTGDPKGVMLSHANLLANIRAMAARLEVGPEDVFVSWLPLYHDMGLIGACLGSLYQGMPLVVMSPLRFLRRPLSWLWAIHQHRGTISAGPNFAYELCLRYGDNVGEFQSRGLDLSSLRFAANGAEPVSPDTLRRFAERFAPYGLDPGALAPVYGLAECSVGLALPAPGRGLKTARLDRAALARDGRAVPAPAGASDRDVLEVAACGHALAGHQLRVVADTGGRELPDGREGRVQFRGPSATRGYLHRPDASAALFDDGWLNTGDRGFIAAGDIYITGRVKDMIIRAGRNIYPYELEQAVGALDGVRKGCVAVFACPDRQAGSERLVVVAETRRQDPAARALLREAIRAATLKLLDTPADEVILAPPYAVLKTSSGKIRRAATRELYLTGRLGKQRGLWWQLARLAGAGVGLRLRRARRALAEYAYGGYAWAVGAGLAPLVGVALLMLPTVELRWRVGGALGRGALRLLGMRLQVSGVERLPAGPFVAVINHASYLDALILACALPQPLRFVAKRELAENAALRLLLGRVRTLFVERFRQQQAGQDSTRLNAAAAADRLAFFPEGTFTRAPGLLPLRMGAFVAAASAGVAVVPIGLRGSRSLLRADNWLPRRATLAVEVGRPVTPEGRDWAAATELRRRAREQLLALTGEPDLSPADSPFAAAGDT